MHTPLREMTLAFVGAAMEAAEIECLRVDSVAKAKAGFDYWWQFAMKEWAGDPSIGLVYRVARAAWETVAEHQADNITKQARARRRRAASAKPRPGYVVCSKCGRKHHKKTHCNRCGSRQTRQAVPRAKRHKQVKRDAAKARPA